MIRVRHIFSQTKDWWTLRQDHISCPRAWGQRGTLSFVVQGGWCLALRRGVEGNVWGRVMALKYANISYLCVALKQAEVGSTKGVTGQEQQQCPTETGLVETRGNTAKNNKACRVQSPKHGGLVLTKTCQYDLS